MASPRMVWFFLCLGFVCSESLFGSLFSSFQGGKKDKDQDNSLPLQQESSSSSTSSFEKYRNSYPIYWKEPDCQPLPVIDRYLLMSRRNGGWNNERMILENAIIFAWVTNRTLVIPSHLRYDHMHGEESFEKFADFSYARCIVPIITSAELPKLSGGVIDTRFNGVLNHPDAHTLEIEFNNAAFAVPSVPTAMNGATYDEFLEFESFRTGRKITHQLTPDDGYFVRHLKSANLEDMEVDVIDNSKRFLNSKNHFFCLFYAFYWFKDKTQHNQMIEIIKHGTHYPEKFWDASLAILNELGSPGSFSSVHIRSRDFRQKSGYYQYFKTKSWIANFRTHHPKTFMFGEKIYLATDERNLTEIKVFQSELEKEFGVKTFTIYDFMDKFNIDNSVGGRRWEFWGDRRIDPNQASKFNLNDLGLIEQIVCAHGRRYVATYFSTYSAHIMTIRGYLPFPEVKTDEHLFWDRTLENNGKCTWNSIPEVCEPSWQGQFRGAIWASEYEEGWKTYEEIVARRAGMSKRSMLPDIKHQKRFTDEERRKYEELAKFGASGRKLVGGGGLSVSSGSGSGSGSGSASAVSDINSLASTLSNNIGGVSSRFEIEGNRLAKWKSDHHRLFQSALMSSSSSSSSHSSHSSLKAGPQDDREDFLRKLKSKVRS